MIFLNFIQNIVLQLVIVFLKNKKKYFDKYFKILKNLYLCSELIINLYNFSKMKKVVFSLALVASMAFVSCKETKTEEVPAEDTTVVVEETQAVDAAPVVDTVAVDTVAAPAAPAN